MVARSHFQKEPTSLSSPSSYVSLARRPLCHGVPSPVNLTMQKTTAQSIGESDRQLVAHSATAALPTCQALVLSNALDQQPRGPEPIVEGGKEARLRAMTEMSVPLFCSRNRTKLWLVSVAMCQSR